MSRKKIIYLDDVSFSLLSMQDRLKHRHDVYPAKTSEDLFLLLEKIDPDLILLDISMPGENGFEVLSRLKSYPHYADIPVVFFTSNNDRNSLLKGMKLGSADYLTKPITNEKLLKTIELHLDPEHRKSLKPVILAVDDNPSILKTINSFLHDRYTVRTLAAPEKLQGLLEVFTPDLFLLDYNMPVLNGFDLAILIRSLPNHENTPIIFITTEGSVDYVLVAVHLGASDFIVKPIDEAILREKVAMHLDDYIIRRRLRSV
jgi:putative two-component system response regulator